jgi:hypothetical protein
LARGGTPNDSITASAVRTRFALGPTVPTLRRLTRAPSLAQLGHPLALVDLELLDHFQPWMPLLGQLDRGVCEIAAALVLGDELADLPDQSVELADRVAGVRRFNFRPGFL